MPPLQGQENKSNSKLKLHLLWSTRRHLIKPPLPWTSQVVTASL